MQKHCESVCGRVSQSVIESVSHNESGPPPTTLSAADRGWSYRRSANQYFRYKKSWALLFFEGRLGVGKGGAGGGAPGVKGLEGRDPEGKNIPK